MAITNHKLRPITFPRVAGLISAAVGLFVLVGWGLQIGWIKSVLPGAVEMKANTALGLLFSGVALCLLDDSSSERRRRHLGQGLALLVALIGLATIAEYALGWRLGIDELLFRDTVKAFNPIPGRMSPYSAVVFAALGLGLATFPIRALRWFGLLAANLTILVGLVSFVGYIWHANELVTDRILPPVAINTAAIFVLLGAGMLMIGGGSARRKWRRLTELTAVEIKMLAGFTAILALLLLMGGHAYNSAVATVESNRWVTHTMEVRDSLDELYGSISDAESQQRNYLLTGKTDYREEYKQHAVEAAQQTKSLAEAVANNPAQAQKVKQLQGLIAERMALLDLTGKTFETSGLAAAQALLKQGEGRKIMTTIRAAIQEIDTVEAGLLKARSDTATNRQFGTLLSLLATLAVATAGFIVLFGGIRRELASRMQAEAERDRFFTLSQDLLCIASTDGHFKRVNPAFTATLGWSEAEMMARPFLDFVHPDDHAATLHEVERQVARGEKVLHFENRYQHKNGAWRVISWNSTPDPDGLMFANGRDVTELHAAAAALRRSEENLSVTLHSIGDAVLATDPEGRVTRLNPVAEKLTGWTQAEAQGRPVAEVFHIVNETTRQPAVIPVEAVLATGIIQGLANHTVIIARDGTERPIADSAAPIRDKDGQILGVVLVFRDVSAERRAEEELLKFNIGLEKLVAQRTAEVREALATLDATADGAYIFEPTSLRFTYVNKGAVRQLGYKREELLKMTVLELKAEQDEAAYREKIAPLIRGEKSVLSYEGVYCRKDRSTLPVEINLQYITPAGESPRFIAIVRDITERKKVEKESQRSQRMESIGTLAGGVAHDLNNALAPIMMSSEMLRMKYPEESQLLEMMESSAKRGADMVRQLLSFAKGAEGERLVLQTARLVQELEKLMKGSFPKDIELVVKVDRKLPTVVGDATQLHQVLLNLCVNARDAMPHGGTLTLEAHPKVVDSTYASSIRDAKPGKYVMLRVRDTGTGIPPEIIDRIFEPFFSTKGPEKGTGLGLSTVVGIVKGHGGFLHVYSQPGQGSTFSVYLPAEAAAGDTERMAKPVGTAFRGQGETILFVDDEANIRTVSREVLRRLNFTPLTAFDGADGLIQVAQHRAALRAVITDLHMPHMDGLTFVRTLRRMLPDLPVVVASGRLEDTQTEEFKALGVTCFLDKPFTEAQLAEVLKELLKPK